MGERRRRRKGRRAARKRHARRRRHSCFETRGISVCAFRPSQHLTTTGLAAGGGGAKHLRGVARARWQPTIRFIRRRVPDAHCARASDDAGRGTILPFVPACALWRARLTPVFSLRACACTMQPIYYRTPLPARRLSAALRELAYQLAALACYGVARLGDFVFYARCDTFLQRRANVATAPIADIGICLVPAAFVCVCCQKRHLLACMLCIACLLPVLHCVVHA